MKILWFSLEKEIQYRECGIMSTEVPWKHAPRVFTMWVLGLCTRGTMYMNIEGVDYKIMAGDMFLLPPNKLHWGPKLSEGAVSYYWIHFTAPQIEEVIKDISDAAVPSDPSLSYLMLHYPLLDIRKASVLCDHLYSIDFGTHYTGNIQQNLFKVLLYEISNQTLLGNVHKYDQRFLRMLDYIRANFASPLSVEVLAAQFGYNKSYLCRLFKHRMGKTLISYCTELRVYYACQQLTGTDYPIKRIAAECGFGSEKYFMRQFKAQTGMTPTTYRNTHLKIDVISK